MPSGAKPGERRGGRQKGTANRSTREIKDVIESIIPARERVGLLAELARGVTIQEVDKKGEVKIYTRPPDGFALKTLEEYASGKPAQRIEHSTPDDKPFPVALIPR